mmetsp:Transcript_45322/g.67327  ORF Transcript_45322/g.67327 Transcript_45322/m.67327 type:complete len:96 (-) Transcript_45322:459-746(-)
MLWIRPPSFPGQLTEGASLELLGAMVGSKVGRARPSGTHAVLNELQRHHSAFQFVHVEGRWFRSVMSLSLHDTRNGGVPEKFILKWDVMDQGLLC